MVEQLGLLTAFHVAVKSYGDWSPRFPGRSLISVGAQDLDLSQVCRRVASLTEPLPGLPDEVYGEVMCHLRGEPQLQEELGKDRKSYVVAARCLLELMNQRQREES